MKPIFKKADYSFLPQNEQRKIARELQQEIKKAVEELKAMKVMKDIKVDTHDFYHQQTFTKVNSHD